MRPSVRSTLTAAAAALLTLLAGCSNGTGGQAAPAQDRPAATAWGAELDAVVDAAPPGSFAVFDADNTLWDNDLTEALLARLDQKRVLVFDRLDPVLRPIPLAPDESLYGYYLRVCVTLGDDACYYWIAAAFSGVPIATLRSEAAAMMAEQKPIPVTYTEDGKLTKGTVAPPRIMPAQRALLTSLRQRGIKVWAVTAANEEIARAVLTDPRNGLGFAPTDVFGVEFLVRDPKSGAVVNTHQLMDEGKYLTGAYPQEVHDRSVITPLLVENPWYVGKQATIERHISAYRKPILVAGDARSDWSMLFHVNTSTATSGIRLWVDKGSPGVEELQAEQQDRARQQREAGVPVDADRGWVVRTQEQLLGG
ncbi:Phosphoserine phosphatase [Pseudonocardia sp. Ae717_Ps2]|uniref:haloacid dehalogenase-like hydrolase n=1 Tax=unclassified Pseudonocardia TaxID=2619320 RepID=UPI0002E4E927|nr:MULTISPECIES: haloacid dehalogenase-like hydrolase [unclassified Pseudonocardia]OLM10924.1 Phosphoserine phosphatase [Pseudonocardia sp. Ae505_Ps2]OLM34060.1 Phosphoserine phosphatase [Pseudonocardia sp. Ae717_Ps2]